MSTSEFADTDRSPGVADFGAFRGRTSRVGAPVLPPGWRPDRDDPVDGPACRVDIAVRPITPPPVAPAGTRSVVLAPVPEARVVPAVAVAEPSADTEVQVLRRVRPWSVWKLALAFSVCMVAVVATAGAVLWAVATGLGVLDNVESLVKDLGFENFTVDGRAMLRALVLGGLIISVGAAMMAAVLAVMFNLLSDLTGGIEAELAPKPPRNRRRLRGRRQARQARKDWEVVDLTEDPPEVDRIQLALDDLLAEPPSPNGR